MRNLLLCRNRLSGIAVLVISKVPACHEALQSVIPKAARGVLGLENSSTERTHDRIHRTSCRRQAEQARPQSISLNPQQHQAGCYWSGKACHASATCEVPATSCSVEAMAICEKAIACELILRRIHCAMGEISCFLSSVGDLCFDLLLEGGVTFCDRCVIGTFPFTDV